MGRTRRDRARDRRSPRQQITHRLLAPPPPLCERRSAGVGDSRLPSEWSRCLHISPAVDNNFNTRWSSATSDPQWLIVDLGGTHTIKHVVLYWAAAAYAKAFQIQTSPDGTTWATIYSTITGTGGRQSIAVSGTSRYVRIYGTRRGTASRYSAVGVRGIRRLISLETRVNLTLR